jgi:hypothetical protein
VAYLEREVKELKKKMNEAESRNKETREIEENSSKDDYVLNSVKHLPVQTEREQFDCIKRMCLTLFTEDDLVKCSRTGKKTVKSNDVIKPALDTHKLMILEKAVMTKIPSMSASALNKKIDNIIKIVRRKVKV